MATNTPFNFFQIDAFTEHAFGGNPAAVVILTKAADDAWMQQMAQEVNLAETAFAWPHEDPFKRAWRLRWFTPVEEVALCGHGTLATAFVLWSEGFLKPTQAAQFETMSGRLSAEYQPNGTITLHFPASQVSPTTAPSGLLAALGLADGEVFHAGDVYLIALDSAETVRTLAPDFNALAALTAVERVMVTAADDGEYDFVSRYFTMNPAMPEDSVTGSAHCKLGPFWAQRLGKSSLRAYQASPRGGAIAVEVADETVKLSGKAVAIIKGQLLI